MLTIIESGSQAWALAAADGDLHLYRREEAGEWSEVILSEDSEQIDQDGSSILEALYEQYATTKNGDAAAPEAEHGGSEDGEEEEEAGDEDEQPEDEEDEEPEAEEDEELEAEEDEDFDDEAEPEEEDEAPEDEEEKKPRRKRARTRAKQK